MTLFKSTFFSCLTIGLKLLNALIMVKLIAIYVGPEGLARTGQFVSFISFLILLAGGGINQGIIKYVSEYKKDKEILSEILGVSQFILICVTIFFGFILFFFNSYFSMLLFGSYDYKNIIILISISQIFMAFNNLLTSIINGYKDILKLTAVNLLGVLTGLIVSTILIIKYGFEGVLLSYIFSQSFLCIYSIYFCSKMKDFNWSYLIPRFKKKYFILLSKFSIMLIASSLLANIAQFFARNHLAQLLSWKDVGYWEGVVRISDAYLMLLTTSISVYCIPVLSSLNDKNKIILELIKIFKLMIPLTIILATSIFLTRDIIIKILFSDSFFPMNDLFFWQLIGDVFRVAGMILGYFLISKEAIKTFIFIELSCSITFCCLFYFLTNSFGLIGSVYAFFVNSCFFFVFVLFASLKKLSNNSNDFGDKYVHSSC